VGTHPKTSHFKTISNLLREKHEKVWERRFHAFPPHYTTANNEISDFRTSDACFLNFC